MLKIAVLQKFDKHPTVIAIRREAEAEAFAEIQAAVDERGLLQEQIEERKSTRAKKVGPMQTGLANLRAKLAAEEQKHRVVDGEFSRDIHALEGRVSLLNRQIIAAADPRILAAAGELFARYNRQRHQLFRVSETPTDLYDYSLGRIVKKTTNADATRHLLALMREAKAALEALTLQNPADVEGAIAAIVAPVNAQWQVVLSFGAPDAVNVA